MKHDDLMPTPPPIGDGVSVCKPVSRPVDEDKATTKHDMLKKRVSDAKLQADNASWNMGEIRRKDLDRAKGELREYERVMETGGDPASDAVEKYVVFDTETTGIFLYRLGDGSPAPADGQGQPRLASFAAIITDADGNEMSREKHYIRPDGWSMPQGELPSGKPAAGKINGLTDEFLTENGVDVEYVLDLWEGYIARGLIPAAFNAQFDAKMMRAELRRAGRDDLFEQTKQTCIMRAMKPYKEQGMVLNRGYVKLSVACDFFGIVNDNPHDAMADTEATVELLKILIRDGNVIPPKVHYAKKAGE